MTTVAFCKDEMAADSACTDGDGHRATKLTKITRFSWGLFGSSGDADQRPVLELLGGWKNWNKPPSRKELAALEVDCGGIIALHTGEVYYLDIDPPEKHKDDWSAQLIPVSDRVAAVGTGAKYAISAMDSGKSARQAVALACKRDSFSCLPVHTVSLKPAPKNKTRKKTQ